MYQSNMNNENLSQNSESSDSDSEFTATTNEDLETRPRTEKPPIRISPIIRG